MEFLKINRYNFVIIIILFAFLFTSCEELILGPEVNNTPEENFDILWKDIDTYYAIFAVKKVDWNAQYNKYRPMVNSGTTESELWNIVSQMLSILNDPHTFIMSRNGTIFNSGFINGRIMDDFDLSVITQKYLSYYKFAGKGNILYGKAANSNIGYIYVKTFSGDVEWSKDIDAVVQELSSCDAMILDIRANGGGATENYQNIASAFIDRNISYLWWCNRNGTGHNDFDIPSLLTIKPREGKYQFTKNIALLTNRFSGSSSDHLTWIFKNYLPYSTQIGDTTVGDFGSIMPYRKLPNGWLYSFTAKFAYSVDRNLAPDSLNGLVPDILVENKKNYLTSGVDSVMERAILYLNSK